MTSHTTQGHELPDLGDSNLASVQEESKQHILDEEAGAAVEVHAAPKRRRSSRVVPKVPTAIVLGTMNVIGEATNPLEFAPSSADLHVLDSTPTTTASTATSTTTNGAAVYEEARVTAASVMAQYTIGEVQTQVGLYEDSNLTSRLTAFCAAKELSSDQSVMELCRSGVLDLSLDNKWVDGRFNPIVLALAPMPGNAAIHQLAAVQSNSGEYLAALLRYYAWAMRSVKADELEQAVGLLLWDLVCTASVATAPDSFLTLSKSSYLVNIDGTAVTRGALFHALAAPMRKVLAEHPGAVMILGCQEMPSEVGPLESALPVGCAVLGLWTQIAARGML